jgi:hypothetical protein
MTFKSLLVSALFFYALNAGAETTKLAAWIGKYPSDKIAGKTVNEIVMKSHLLKKLLPSHEARLINTLTTEDLITQNGEYILIFKCKPHDCPGSHSMIIRDSKSDLWIGIYQNKGGVVSTRWYGTSEYTELPMAIQKLFIRGHVPE